MLLETTREWVQYVLFLQVLVFFDLAANFEVTSVMAGILWFLQWPVGLLPLLGWLRNRRRHWLYLQLAVLLVYVAISVHFLLTFKGF